MDNTSIDKNEKKKRKKTFKKALKGDINSVESYVKCVQFGVIAEPTITFQNDKSWNASTYDLNVSDIRDLLIGLLTNRPIPKSFIIKNKLFIRNICILHLHDCSQLPVSILRKSIAESIENQPKSFKVRLSKTFEAVPIFLNKLMLLSINHPLHSHRLIQSGAIPDSIDTPIPSCLHEPLSNHPLPSVVSEGNQRIMCNLINFHSSLELYKSCMKYSLNKSALLMWGYPSKVESPASPALSLSIGSTTHQNRMTNNKLDIGRVGVRCGVVLTMEEVEDILRSMETMTGSLGEKELFSLVKIDDNKYNNQMFKLSESKEFQFINTLSVESNLFVALFVPDNSINPREVTHGLERSHKKPKLETESCLSGLVCTEMKPLAIAAMDCEMCENCDGLLELTRVTIIDQHSTVHLDALVQPDKPISNYRTAFSGITAEMLSDVTVTLREVQIAILRLIVAETILIGHSLDSDLKALRLCHHRLVDTSVIYPHPRGYPYRLKLKKLAEDYLQIRIQQSQQGHDSIEDARTAMNLVLMKVERGPSFGISGEDHHGDVDRLSLIEAIRSELSHQQQSKESSDADIIQYDPHLEAKVFFMEGPSSDHTSVAKLKDILPNEIVSCNDDKDWESSLRGFLSSPSHPSGPSIASCGRFRLIVNSLSVNRWMPISTASNEVHPMSPMSEGLDHCMATLRNVFEAANEKCLLLVTSQPSMDQAVSLMNKKKLFSSYRKDRGLPSDEEPVVWNHDHESQLREEIKKCSCGEFFFDVL